MPCRVTQDWRVTVEISDNMWSTEEGNDKPLHILAFRIPWTLLKGTNMTLKDELPRFLCNIAPYSTDFISITSHIHNWVFLLWLHLFILSGVISPLISNSILGTYWPREVIFQCSIFLPFLTVHGVLKARILKWFAIPFSSGPHFVRTLHHDPSVLGGHTQHGS